MTPEELAAEQSAMKAEQLVRTKSRRYGASPAYRREQERLGRRKPRTQPSGGEIPTLSKVELAEIQAELRDAMKTAERTRRNRKQTFDATRYKALRHEKRKLTKAMRHAFSEMRATLLSLAASMREAEHTLKHPKTLQEKITDAFGRGYTLGRQHGTIEGETTGYAKANSERGEHHNELRANHEHSPSI